MNALTHTLRYLVSLEGELPVRWSGRQPLILGNPARLMVEKMPTGLRVRSLRSEEGKTSWVKEFQEGSFPNSGPLTIRALRLPHALDFDEISLIHPLPLPQPRDLNPEDQRFRTTLQRSAGALSLLLLALLFTQGILKTKNGEEPLIPQKFARVILERPKDRTPPGSSQARSGRPQKSGTLDKSMQRILKSSISKVNLMPSGRSLETLARNGSASGNTDWSGKIGALIAKGAALPGLLGGNGIYGTKTGPGVQGQGNHPFEIGVESREAIVDEGLTREEVARVIHSHMSEIRFCYENAILRDPTLAGKLLVDFKIAASGRVPNAGVSDGSLRDSRVSECLLSKLKTWKFPSPRGGVVVAVSYPFIFKSLSR